MNNHTKRFIEDHIDEITKNNWQSIFDSWYDETYETSLHKEAQLFEDFVYVLQSAEVIKSIDEFKEQRAKTIMNWLDKIIQAYINNNFYFQTQSKFDVSYDDLFNQLYSWLGFDTSDLDKIIEDFDDAELTPQPSKRTLLIDLSVNSL